jgi:hypothetical protein
LNPSVISLKAFLKGSQEQEVTQSNPLFGLAKVIREAISMKAGVSDADLSLSEYFAEKEAEQEGDTEEQDLSDADDDGIEPLPQF